MPYIVDRRSRSEEEVDNIVTFLTGFTSFALAPLWSIAVAIVLFRRDGGTPRDTDRPT